MNLQDKVNQKSFSHYFFIVLFQTGRTAVILALEAGHMNIAEHLLKSGADPNIQEKVHHRNFALLKLSLMLLLVDPWSMSITDWS